MRLGQDVSISFAAAGICFADHPVLHDLNFTLRPGSIVAVRGANGSGKSTLLRLAAGLLRPTAGRVTACGAEAELERGDWQASIACLTPELSFYPLLTAEENLVFFLGLRGISLTREEKRQLFRRVGLPGAEDWRKVSASFSTGMGQRLKLAVLLASDAPVWLLDEPGANLDDAGRGLVASLAQEAAGEGRLVLWATNDAGEEAAADATIHLERGEARLS